MADPHVTARYFDYSVVIPCLDAARTLPRALEHLTALVPAAREIVVADDGSSDGCPAIAARVPRVTVVGTGPRGGPGRTRNAGARAATAPWLLFVDSDCYVDAEGFARARAWLAARPDLAGVMGVFAPDGPAGPFAGVYKNYFRHLEIAAMRNPPPVFNSSCFLIRRDAFFDVGGFDERLGTTETEDNELYFRLVRRGHVVPYLVDFAFVHDKPMRLAELVRDDAHRAAAIVQNLRGRLGEPGRGWSPAEKVRWAAEVAAGNAAALLPVAAVLGAAGLPGARAVGALAGLGAFGLAALLQDKLARAHRDHGVGFAARLFAYRAVEMVAAAAGAARAVVTGSVARPL